MKQRREPLPDDDQKCEIHCRRTGILTQHEIRDLAIIDNDDIDEKCLKGTSYDMRLGDRHFVYQRNAQQWVPIFIGDEEGLKEANESTPIFCREDSLIIEPYGTALIQHEETVDLFECTKSGILVSGRFDLKLKVVAKGLFSQQATQVEPYSRGKLFCYLFNLTPNQIELCRYDKISTIEFYYISCITYCDTAKRDQIIASFNDEHKGGKYQRKKKGGLVPKDFCNDHGINDIRFFSRKEGDELSLPKHGGLTHLYLDFMKFRADLDVDKITQQAVEAASRTFQGKFDHIKIHFNWVSVFISVFCTLIAGLAGLYFMYPSFTQANKQIEELKAEVKTLKESPKQTNNKPQK